MENKYWLIEIKHDDVKKMFDPIIDRIIRIIHIQLSNTRETCSAMFLIGEFSLNKYLQKRIKQEFLYKLGNISVPKNPTSAISRGAVLYAVSSNVISTRVLKYNYGIEVRNKWVSFFDI